MNQNKTTLDLSIIEEKLHPIIKRAETLQITDSESMKESVSFLSQCNSYLDDITEDKEKITKPLNAALKEIRTKYKPLETILEKAIGYLRSEQSRYQTEQVRIQKMEEAKIAARVLPGKGNLSIETAADRIASIDVADKKVETDNGNVSFKEVQKLKIVDPALIPRQYLIIDERAVLEALKAGTTIPGATIELVQVPVNYR